jgi:hypothetical protein
VVWALPFCARQWRRRAILLTDWFFSEDGGRLQDDGFLDYAGEILLLDFSVAHPGPHGTSAPIRTFGQVVAEFDADRESSRAALGLAADTPAAVLTVGGVSNTRSNRLIAHAVLDTWLEHAPAGHRLLVLAEPFRDIPADRSDDVVWVGLNNTPERYYTAADLVIVNAYGTVTCDLVWNGVPVLGMTSSEGPYPESFAARVEAMAAAGLIAHGDDSTAPAELWGLMSAGMERGRSGQGPDRHGDRDRSAFAAFEWATGAQVAAHLLKRLDDMAAKGAPVPVTASEGRP